MGQISGGVKRTVKGVVFQRCFATYQPSFWKLSLSLLIS